MRLVLIAALLASAAPVFAHETAAPAAQSKPVPKEDLLKPPADAVRYVVVSEAGQHGNQWRWQLPDGRTAYRWSQELRGWITEMDQVTTFAPGGTIEALTVRGVTTSGDAAEEYRVAMAVPRGKRRMMRVKPLLAAGTSRRAVSASQAPR